MKRAILLLVVVSLGCASRPAVLGEADGQTREVIRQLTQAVARQPDNTPYMYLLATYQARAGNVRQAVRWLKRLDRLGWDHGVNTLDFKIDSPALRAVVARLEAREPRVSRARTAFTISGRRELVPEGIAYDPIDDVFYISSIEQKKVVRVDRRGNATDFATADHGTLGMKVDPKRRLLWVAATDQKANRSTLIAYHLSDRSRTKRIEATPALLNDLALLDDGSLFATDMGRGKVLRLPPGGDALEEWADRFSYPNGIAVSFDQLALFVADFRGITRFDLTDQTRTQLEADALLNGIDGLTFDRGTLIGIQNAIGSPRVIRIHIAAGRVEILESKNPLFEVPLTGAVVGDEYYFIANPGLLVKPEGDLVMLAIPLRG